MAIIHRTNQPLDIIPGQQQWRWYHGIAFYVIVQVLTFGLSGLVSTIKGPAGKDLRENIFGNPAYFNELETINFRSAIMGIWTSLARQQHLRHLGNMASSE